MHEAAPVGEYVPPPQVIHVESLDAAMIDEEVPDGQRVQVLTELAPVSAEYVPLPQTEHVTAPATLEYVPALQAEHAVLLVAPRKDDDVPGGQSMQLLAPALAEYEPAPHSEQANDAPPASA